MVPLCSRLGKRKFRVIGEEMKIAEEREGVRLVLSIFKN